MLKYIIIFFTSISIAVSATISFNIDAGNLDIPNADYQSIVVNGSWNNWEPWGVTLSDSNEDGIFSGEIDLDNGTYEYLISATGPADNWSGWGLVINAPMGSDCDYYPGDEWPNYGFVVNNSDIEQSYCAGSCDSQCENNGGGENLNYTLVWSDEFDENEIDETKWNFEIGTGNGGWGNGEDQYYTSRSENAFIEDGKLIIQALNESYAGSNYTSAKMTTENKADFLYGKIVASIKVPAAGGTWPAFWMLPTNSVYGGWPNSGEMDIMEHYGCHPGHVHSTVHNNTYNWAGGIPPTGYNIYTNATSEFLEYEMEWSDDELKFFVDGSYIGQTAASGNIAGAAGATLLFLSGIIETSGILELVPWIAGAGTVYGGIQFFRYRDILNEISTEGRSQGYFSSSRTINNFELIVTPFQKGLKVAFIKHF